MNNEEHCGNTPALISGLGLTGSLTSNVVLSFQLFKFRERSFFMGYRGLVGFEAQLPVEYDDPPPASTSENFSGAPPSLPKKLRRSLFFRISFTELRYSPL